jgi:hypothetical protein
MSADAQRLSSLNMRERTLALKHTAKKTVNIRLTIAEFEEIVEMAEQSGERVQVVMRQALRDGLTYIKKFGLGKEQPFVGGELTPTYRPPTAQGAQYTQYAPHAQAWTPPVPPPPIVLRPTPAAFPALPPNMPGGYTMYPDRVPEPPPSVEAALGEPTPPPSNGVPASIEAAMTEMAEAETDAHVG